jgi:hypothetical protein
MENPPAFDYRKLTPGEWSHVAPREEVGDDASLPPASEPAFEFLGCDLIDDLGISALTNRGGGFPAAFSDTEISELGLIRTLERAKKMQADLRSEYPNEAHADCSLWAFFRSAGCSWGSF